MLYFDIVSWLHALGLERYAEIFIQHHLDAETLPLVTEADLEKLGIDSLGHRKKLIAAIARLSGALDAQSSRELPVQGSGPMPAAGEHADERRTVTVLFCDIADFTRMSGSSDPEEIHSLLNRYFEIVDNLVALYGGHVDKHIGDAVMAVFGAPIAHTNDPERAVRAAFAIHEAVTALEPPVRVHIGIASGQVVASRTGSDAHHEYTMTGTPVNLASRLQDRARAGEILVSESVHRAVRRWVESTSVEGMMLKGIAGTVRVWRLERLLPELAAEPEAPLVGRHEELALFTQLLGACRRERGGRVVHVRGEAGIGKSRLVEELWTMAAAEGFSCHSGQVLDFGNGQGVSAIAELACSLLGLRRISSVEQRMEAAADAVSRGLVERHQDVYLSAMLGVPHTSAQRTRYDAMTNALRTLGQQATLARLLAARAREQPVLVIIEDLHWAHAEVLGHVVALAGGIVDLPVLLAVTSRPPSEPLAGLMAPAEHVAAAPVTTLMLEPLRRLEALLLASRFIDTSTPLARSYVERAGGNPLFLEQLLRNADSPDGQAALPDSVQSTILARMDNLAPADKRALQTASVMGQRLSLEALRFLLDDPGYSCTSLVAQHLFRPAGQGEYVFVHALVLEGVYSSLLRAHRRALHQRAAEWFCERDLVLRAEHLERADDPGAPRAYLAAARREVSEYRFERALELTLRGRELAARVSDADAEHALACLQGEIAGKLGDMDASISAYADALAVAWNDAMRCRAWLGMADGLRIVDRTDEAMSLIDRATAAAEAHGLTEELATAYYLRGNLLFPRGDLDGCQAAHQRARALAEQAGSPLLVARALGGLGDADYMRGRMISAHEHFDRCIELCRKHGFGGIEVANLPMRGITRYYQNDLSTALRDCADTATAARMVGQRRAEIIARNGCMAWILIEMNRLDEARKELESALALARELGARRFEPNSLTHLGRILSLRGRHEEGQAMIQDSLAICREMGMAFVGPMALGALAVTTRDPEVRRRALAEGEELVRRGSVSHNVFYFYRDAVEACLVDGDLAAAERYLASLESYTQAEPLPWTSFFIARGRALVRHQSGERSDDLVATLVELCDQALVVGLELAAERLELALDEQRVLGSVAGHGS